MNFSIIRFFMFFKSCWGIKYFLELLNDNCKQNNVEQGDNYSLRGHFHLKVSAFMVKVG